jgi:glycosyltransferase involved in cell wall biosynthesis
LPVDGPDAERLKAIAGPNVTFVGFVSDEKLRELMATARAFVFAAEEDFGIIVVEAESEGAPVSGVRPRRRARDGVGVCRISAPACSFDSNEPAAIAECVRAFVAQESVISRGLTAGRSAENILGRALSRNELMSFVNDQMRTFSGERRRGTGGAVRRTRLASSRRWSDRPGLGAKRLIGVCRYDAARVRGRW